MAERYQSVKGTRDILPEEAARWRRAEGIIHEVMGRWGFGEIRTPAFEPTALFVRTVGEHSDIVSKQMYTFTDQGGESLTLKPEETAPVMRAYLQHGMSRSGALTRLYYLDTLFRQERPQAGRLRQFHQLGAEAIGSPHPEQDADVIALAWALLGALGIHKKTLLLNSIGSADSRQRYRDALVAFLKPSESQLSEISRKRLATNPLRILDSKDPEEQELVRRAPAIGEYLDDADRAHYDEVKHLLPELKIPFVEDPALVRGLDYYSRTTFEITSEVLGAQNALCGGGRYDDLISALGGPATPAVGFAAGIERILLAAGDALGSKNSPSPATIFLATATEESRPAVMGLAHHLRAAGLGVEWDTLRRSLKAQMREAGRLGCSHVAVIGDQERASGEVAVKNFATGQGVPVAIDQLGDFLRSA